ncbi:MAG TPA: DUF4834 family protein [Candidatus Coprenecus stercoravium]|uniref:DUF4834 family protein n=1 Tax=Candidatus Coprenecus stercoravium TaxID=2840735 RepID=A0A9D2GRH4_9BACT|nr:DUF4834 family protein [Candidatus Coprenecus stercoravium]
MAFISTLLLIVVCGILFLLMLPMMLLRRFRGGGASAHGSGRRNWNQAREGEVSVSGKDAAAGEKIVGDNVGEYVDYEEVDDKKE